MLMKFLAVISFSPIFTIPGAIVAAIGGWCGQIYMKAQLSVKREMSNARAPVLGHFGAAIAGLSEYPERIDIYGRIADWSFSLHPCLWRARPVQEGVVPEDRQICPCRKNFLQLEQVCATYSVRLSSH